MAADLVVRGGTLLDGTGGDPYLGDLVIEDGRIAQIGIAGQIEAIEVDATGLYVAPGFIDIHSHSDYTLLIDPRAASAIHQGVTLEVIGNCGHGCFPINDPTLARNAIYGYGEEVPLTWSRAAEYFDRLEQAAPAVNVLSLVPNGQLRLSVVGLQDRAATPTELREMTFRLESALDEGAWGFSTGLEYAAEASVPEEEIEVLCASVAKRDALYATHTRRRDEGAADAVQEAVRTAERAGARLQVSHLTPRNGLEEAHRCIDAVEVARQRGLDIAFDMHTRLFGFTFLSAALPAWAVREGPERLGELLRDKAARQRMKSHQSILSSGDNWQRIVLLDNDLWPDYARRDVSSIAGERGQEPLDTIYDLLLADLGQTHRMMVMIHCYSEQQQRETFAHPLCMPGSDATTLAPDGPLANSVFYGAYTWASWFYRFMVRDAQLLSPQDAVNRMTAMPAERLRLSDRGVLRHGACADLAIFDPERFGESGTAFQPNQLATGMRHVIVNGVVTLQDGVLTGSQAGEVLRRS